MITKMKKPVKVITAIGSVLVITSCIILASITKAQADTETASKKLLKTCQVQSGTVVIQIGNTCDSGGSGCSANPCYATAP